MKLTNSGQICHYRGDKSPTRLVRGMGKAKVFGQLPTIGCLRPKRRRIQGTVVE